LGKQVVGLFATQQPVEQKLSFLPGFDGLIPAGEFNEKVDVFIAVDVPNVDRLKDAVNVQERADLRITIDHHPADVAMSELNYIDPASPSAADLVWELLKELGLCDSELALCILTGIMTDTGRFSYQNTTPTCLIHAAETIEAGAQPNLVAREYFQSRTLESLRLEEIVLSHMAFFCNNTVVVSYLVDEDFRSVGATRADAEVLIDELRGIAGVNVALILKENEEHAVRGSLRAKDDTDVEQVARIFGGGGHKAAAGLTFHGSVREALSQIAAELIRSVSPENASAEIDSLHTFLAEQKALN
jgi:phosphoesterase RecJ-like protein